MLIDTHAHVNFKDFREDGDEVIGRALASDVQMINVGAQYSTSLRAVEYAGKYNSGVWAAVGLHPIHLRESSVRYKSQDGMETEAKTVQEEFEYEKYLTLARESEVVAIGETGLDYHHFKDGDDIEKLKLQQRDTFIQFINLANEVQKPILIHCWDAYDDVLEIIKEHEIVKRGVVHCFIGSYKTARLFRELGYKLGFNGIITYSDSYNKVITDTPLEDILVETDCPYLTPLLLDKTARNEPLNVRHVAQRIAEIKKVGIREVEEKTTRTAGEVFNLEI